MRTRTRLRPVQNVFFHTSYPPSPVQSAQHNRRHLTPLTRHFSRTPFALTAHPARFMSSSSNPRRGGGGSARGRGGSARGGRGRGGSSTNKPYTALSSRVISDPRFSHAHTDPRFSRPRTAQHSFTPDARFNRMFTDGAFGSEAAVDKWGRRVKVKGGERLKKFYGIGEGQSEEGKDEKGEVKEEEEEVKEDELAKKSSKNDKKQKQQSTKQQKARKADDDNNDEDSEEKDDQMEDNSEEDAIEEDADDTYSKSYLSSRDVAPPSSDDNNDEDDDAEPASPTFPNILGSDSDDSDIEPLYNQADADAAEDEQYAEEEQIELGDATDTVALVNMDWDRLRAVDIYMLCRSFVLDSGGDGGGRVVSVVVYRSEFGKERMVEEDKYGPIGLYGGSVTEYRERIDQKVREQMAAEEKLEAASNSNEDAASDDEDAADENESAASADEQADEPKSTTALPRAINNSNLDDDDGENVLDQELLRKYELSRLRYFYAIIRCSSIAAATTLYTSLDNSEFESSANKLDLRFVPSDTAFDPADVRDECSESDMDERAMTEYRAPSVFVTKALQHSRVELTWDADDEERKRKLKAGRGGGGGSKGAKGKKGGVELDEGEDDLQVYLASDDDDAYGSDAVVEASDDDGEDRPVLKKKARARYASLLTQLKNPDTEADDGEDDDEEDGEEDGERVIEMTFEPGLKAKAEELVKRVNEREQHKNETAFERRSREVREKKKERKKQNKSANNADKKDEDEQEAEEDVVDVDMDDEFFKGAFDDDEYMPAKEPAASRAKAFFADDGRKQREDKKSSNNSSKRRTADDDDEDEDDDGKAGGASDDEEKNRQAELELLLMPNHPGDEDETDGKKHYHLSQLIKDNKSKSKSKQSKSKPATTSTTTPAADWHVDVTDPRFTAMYSRPDYSIDPTHPDYRPTAEMERVLAERQRRRVKETKQRETTVKQRKEAAKAAADQSSGAAAAVAGGSGGGLDALVASVKAKTKARDSEVKQRKQKDAENRKVAAAGGQVGAKRMGEQPLQANNKKQKLKGDMRI